MENQVKRLACTATDRDVAQSVLNREIQRIFASAVDVVFDLGSEHVILTPGYDLALSPNQYDELVYVQAARRAEPYEPATHDEPILVDSPPTALFLAETMIHFPPIRSVGPVTRLARKGKIGVKQAVNSVFGASAAEKASLKVDALTAGAIAEGDVLFFHPDSHDWPANGILLNHVDAGFVFQFDDVWLPVFSQDNCSFLLPKNDKPFLSTAELRDECPAYKLVAA